MIGDQEALGMSTAGGNVVSEEAVGYPVFGAECRQVLVLYLANKSTHLLHLTKQRQLYNRRTKRHPEFRRDNPVECMTSLVH